MELLQEFLGPIPLPIMALAVFALILFLLISRFFRMPENFAMKEEVREEIRFRLFYRDMEDAAKAAKEDAGAAESADGAGAEPAAVPEGGAAGTAKPA